MKRTIAVVVFGALLVALFGGCERKEPAEPPPPEPAPGAKQPTVPSVPTLPPGQSNPEAEEAAVQAANAWLKLVDASQYAKSWQQAAEFFRNAVTQEKWEKSCQAFREPLGELLSREFKATHYTTTAPGAPDGQYVIAQYNSSFENKESAVETVTPMLDNDGKWRVSGYYIK
jgi:hypothetical protein